MYPKILLFVVPAALLFAAVLTVFFWDYGAKKPGREEPGNGQPEGAFRAFYHILWILIFWSGLGLSLPLWFSYRERIESLPLPERWVFIGKIIAFPLLLLVLLSYGAKKGYLKWIESLSWPDKENE